jgi:hypothetical protein
LGSKSTKAQRYGRRTIFPKNEAWELLMPNPESLYAKRGRLSLRGIFRASARE